jgi:hypothetical protein
MTDREEFNPEVSHENSKDRSCSSNNVCDRSLRIREERAEVRSRAPLDAGAVRAGRPGLAQERVLIQDIRERTPLVETYICRESAWKWRLAMSCSDIPPLSLLIWQRRRSAEVLPTPGADSAMLAHTEKQSGSSATQKKDAPWHRLQSIPHCYSPRRRSKLPRRREVLAASRLRVSVLACLLQTLDACRSAPAVRNSQPSGTYGRSYLSLRPYTAGAVREQRIDGVISRT